MATKTESSSELIAEFFEHQMGGHLHPDNAEVLEAFKRTSPKFVYPTRITKIKKTEEIEGEEAILFVVEFSDGKSFYIEITEEK